MNDRHQRLAFLRQAVLHFRRDLRILFPVDEPIRFKLFQRTAQRLEGNCPDIPLHLIEPDRPELHQGVQNIDFILSLNSALIYSRRIPSSMAKVRSLTNATYGAPLAFIIAYDERQTWKLGTEIL